MRQRNLLFGNLSAFIKLIGRIFLTEHIMVISRIKTLGQFDPRLELEKR